MKEYEDNNLEQFMGRAIKETPLQSPSLDFTAKVMGKVLAMEKSKATRYKPVISKAAWGLIFAGIVTAIVYFIINGSTQPVDHSWSLGMGVKDFFTIGDIHLFQFSRLTIYVVVLSTIMILIQISLLKNYLDKRFQK